MTALFSGPVAGDLSATLLRSVGPCARLQCAGQTTLAAVKRTGPSRGICGDRFFVQICASYASLRASTPDRGAGSAIGVLPQGFDLNPTPDDSRAFIKRVDRSVAGRVHDVENALMGCGLRTARGIILSTFAAERFTG